VSAARILVKFFTRRLFLPTCEYISREVIWSDTGLVSAATVTEKILELVVANWNSAKYMITCQTLQDIDATGRLHSKYGPYLSVCSTGMIPSSELLIAEPSLGAMTPLVQYPRSALHVLLMLST